MNNIAKRLHQVREHRHISQGQIAKAIGVSVGTVQNYEHARTHIPADRLEQLARALQCEPADLLAPPEAPPPRYRRPRYAL
jgi:transcriptional regulator with XRE-family HTH domain